MTRTRPRLAAAALGVVLLTGAAACGDDDPPTSQDPPSTASPSGSPSGSTSESASESTSESTSTPAAPSVTPATGIELVEETSAVRAPEGWTAGDPLLDYASPANGPGRRDTLQLVDSGSISGGGVSLDDQAQSAIASLPKGAKSERLPDVDLAGTPAFHIHYTVPGDPALYDTITTTRNGRDVGIDFILDKKTAAQNPQLIESVLATWRWLS